MTQYNDTTRMASKNHTVIELEVGVHQKYSAELLFVYILIVEIGHLDATKLSVL